jgi:hypothetical protein
MLGLCLWPGIKKLKYVRLCFFFTFFKEVDDALFIPVFFFLIYNTMKVFGSVVVVAFQIAFRAEIHANDVFLFFKNYF